MAEWKEPVQVCNLQTDDSSVAEPSARDDVWAIAAPIIGSNFALEETIRIAKPVLYKFIAAERNRLMQAGKQIALCL